MNPISSNILLIEITCKFDSKRLIDVPKSFTKSLKSSFDNKYFKEIKTANKSFFPLIYLLFLSFGNI